MKSRGGLFAAGGPTRATSSRVYPEVAGMARLFSVRGALIPGGIWLACLCWHYVWRGRRDYAANWMASQTRDGRTSLWDDPHWVQRLPWILAIHRVDASSQQQSIYGGMGDLSPLQIKRGAG